MLIVSGLQDNVKQAFCPFPLVTNTPQGTQTKFQANPLVGRTQWKIHVLILILTVFLGIYKFISERAELEDKVLNIWKICFFLLHASFAWLYHRHASGIAEFFNQLNNFERRYQGT